MKPLLIFIILLSGWFSPVSVKPDSEEAVVRAVLFYSPSCGHCHYVIQEVLPPLFENYGDKLQIVSIDVSQPGAHTLFSAALANFNLEISGVPALFVGDQMLVGSVDIPEKFPALIEEYLAQGGVDWPTIPGLLEVISASQTDEAVSSTSVPNQSTTTSTLPAVAEVVTPEPTRLKATIPNPTEAAFLIASDPDMSLGERFALDPRGNTLAVIVLAGMILSFIGLLLFLSRNRGQGHPQALDWLIPLLCVLGLGVAGYLTYVETTQVSAVCGPVGDCNAVQKSQYAHLFGVLPIGVLGLLGYAAMGIAWIISRSGKRQAAALGSLALFLMSVLGVLFSIYLTFLEPFVIGATCAWCLTSAILMTGLMWLSASRGLQVWTQLQGNRLTQDRTS